MGAHMERALLLFGQSRYDLAENELRQELGDDPHNPMVHSLLGLCLGEQKRFDEATREVKMAVREAPDVAFTFYALARVMHLRDRLDDAESAIEEAIRLNPHDAVFFSVLAGIQYDQGRWQDALKAAEEGLAIDPEHVGSANLRALALVKLGRSAEAGTTLEAALARDPENSVTHANQGWALLNQGEHAKALEHFREALRLDPNSEIAREGVVEALKARNLVYRLLLRYFLWMSRLSARVQWMVLVGGFLAFRGLRYFATKNPDVAPFVWPVLIVYLLFSLLTWIADPLFNLLLRLDKFGRLVLSREQVVASNWVGGCVLSGLVMVVIWLITGTRDFLIGGGVFGLLCVPLAGTFSCAPGWPRRVMGIYTGLLAFVGLSALTVLLTNPAKEDTSKPVEMGRLAGYVLLGLFMLGGFVSGWVANGLMMVRQKR